jgi:hypothetical protein
VNINLKKSYSLMAIGELSFPLIALIESKKLEQEGLSVDFEFVLDSQIANDESIHRTAYRTVDCHWLFINQGDMRNAFIEKAIFDLTRSSPVFLFCYVEGDKAGSREEFFWPEGWPKDVGPAGIVLSEYSASTFHYVEKQLGVSTSIAHNASEYLKTGVREMDPLYPLAKALLKQSGHSSISLLIRHLNIGYTRAGSLVEAYMGEVGKED